MSLLRLIRIFLAEDARQRRRSAQLKVEFRRGWKVRNLDFAYFDDLYNLRTVLEIAAVQRICQMEETPQQLLHLKSIWLVPKAEREKDGRTVGLLDESFHITLVAATGNAEMTRVHVELTEKMRIIRRLDFTQGERVDATYQEHGKILQLLLRRKLPEAEMLLRSHIEQSRLEVRKITLHRLHQAQQAICIR